MESSTIKDRVIWARERKGWSQARLLEECQRTHGTKSIKQASLSKIERGGQISIGSSGPYLADILEVNLVWLSTGQGNPEIDQNLVREPIGAPIKYAESAGQDDVLIKQYREIHWAAGSASVNDQPTEHDSLSFKRSYLERNNLKAENCIACPVTGDSMSPTINDGDTILINRDEKDLSAKDGRIFAFAFGEECRIKRVYLKITGEIRLVSDNPNKNEYPDEIIAKADLNQLHVAGRVRWSGGDK